MCLQAGMPFRRAVSLARERGATYGWFDVDFAVEGVGEGGVDAVGDLLARNGIEPFLIGNDVFSRIYPRRPRRRQADGPSRAPA